MTTALLCCEGICKHFGGVRALHNISLHINEGEIYGLIGPNGAGKTTFFNCLTGLYVPESGQFTFNQQTLLADAPHLAAQQGIARTFQNIRLFGNMTALENVMLGQHVRSHQGVFGAISRSPENRAEETHIRRRAEELLHYVDIADKANAPAASLSYGDQRRLEIARALATEPKLLCLDEPAAGMNGSETAELRILIEGIRRDGTTVLLIEHDVKLVMGLCDRVAVLDYGELICQDTPAVVQRDPRVIEAYLGGGEHA